MSTLSVPFDDRDRPAIHELLSLHGHLMDERQLDNGALGHLFAADVRYDVSALGGDVLVGVAAIRDASLRLGSGNPMAHLVTNVVDPPSKDGDSAAARSEGLGVTREGRLGSVTYPDLAVRPEHGWRISSRTVTPRICNACLKARTLACRSSKQPYSSRHDRKMLARR